MRISRTRAVALATAALALGAAAPAGAQTLHGTVVHHNHHGHSFVVALHDGTLRAVHAHKLPAVGRVVAVDARALRNGTFAAQHVRGRKHGRHVHLRGTITFADRAHHRIVISSSGTSLLLRCRRGNVRAVGTTVDVRAVVPAGGLPVAQTVTPVGTDLTVDIEGRVVAVDAAAGTLTLSADDDEQSGAQLTIAVPPTAGIDLTKVAPGDELKLLVSLHSDGTYTLVGLAGDGNSQEADDPGHEQGDQGDDGDHHGGQSGQDDQTTGQTGGGDRHGSDGGGGEH